MFSWGYFSPLPQPSFTPIPTPRLLHKKLFSAKGSFTSYATLNLPFLRPPTAVVTEQAGQLGVAATPNCEDDVYWTHMEGKKSGGSDQKFFDHHTCYVGYNVVNAFYSAIKQ